MKVIVFYCSLDLLRTYRDFTKLIRMLDICEDYFMYRGWKYARLDGSTTRPRRALDIRLFNQKNSRTPLHNWIDISISMLSDQYKSRWSRRQSHRSRHRNLH
jgi:hypothetical protein